MTNSEKIKILLEVADLKGLDRYTESLALSLLERSKSFEEAVGELLKTHQVFTTADRSDPTCLVGFFVY